MLLIVGDLVEYDNMLKEKKGTNIVGIIVSFHYLDLEPYYNGRRYTVYWLVNDLILVGRCAKGYCEENLTKVK